MRYAKDLLLERVVLHVVDAHANEAIVTQQELSITENVEEFVRKHVIKSLNSDDTCTGRFLSKDVEVAQHVQAFIDDNDTFLEVSKELTEHMFDIMKNTDIPSGDMLFVQFVADEQRCFGILKLDYQMSQMHTIQFDEDEENPLISLIFQESGLPKASQGLKKCVFFTKSPENEIEMIVINKRQKLEEGNEDYFVEKFLEAVLVPDDTTRTRRFRPIVELWTQKNLSEQIEVANMVRGVVSDALLQDEVIEIDEFVSNVFSNIEDSEDMTESFKEAVTDAGYKEGSEFLVDKIWVDKKMKGKQIKTDTGIVIKGDADFFKDTQRFDVKDNGDGTVDYIIKGVRNVIER